MSARDRLSQVILIVGGGILLLLGLSALFAPATVADPIGMRMMRASAFNEVRASLGGAHITLALFMLVGVVVPSARRTALRLLVIFMGGLIGGRVVSFFADGNPGRPTWLLLAVELVLLVAGIAAILSHPPPAARRRVPRQAPDVPVEQTTSRHRSVG